MADVTAERRELAICVRQASKSYGNLAVLCELDMDVPSGIIYGLLGSSGCGKTTLLRCILGRLTMASGEVTVLGKPPGTRGHHVPGRDVGYMPQELALYGDFTMLETMYYFGMLHGMGRKKVRARGEFLLRLLELPSQTKLIRKLSGGQQRRVSFAVAMLQEPPLLILDEPTVGVDPLLRSKIWHHLLELVSTQHTTIIITTHYIEEARQAHMVGLMRDGQLLEQSEPNALINYYGMASLEEVFLHLCRRQDAENNGSPYEAINSPIREEESLESSDEETPLLSSNGATNGRRKRKKPGKKSQREGGACGEDRAKKCFKYVTNMAEQTCQNVISAFSCNSANCCPRPQNVLALCWKNFAKIYRNPWLVIFQFLLPTFQVSLLCLTLGRNLHGVQMTYVDADQGGSTGIASLCTGHENLTTGPMFIDILSKDDTFQLHNCSSKEDAVEQVKKGNAWAAVVIGKDFTVDLFKRVNDPTNATINDGSTIYLYMDITNSQVAAVIENNTAFAFETFAKHLFNLCGINSSAISLPLKIHQPPVYGEMGLSFTDFMGPGIITTTALGISIGLTAVVLIQERKEGLIDRTWVAGVNVTEVIASQVITQFFILLVQILLMLVFVLFVFKIYYRSAATIPLLILLALLQGLTGMSFGLVISALCGDVNTAMQVAIAAFYPVLVLSGVLWPLEGMPDVLRYIGATLPVTFPAQAMRAVMARGWGLEYLEVWRGFVVTTAWFLIFLFIAGVGLRIRK